MSILERGRLAQHEAARLLEYRQSSRSSQSVILPVRLRHLAIWGPLWEETSIFSKVFRGLLVSIAHLGYCELGVGWGCFYLSVTLNLTLLIAKEGNDYLGSSSRAWSILLVKAWCQVPGHTESSQNQREKNTGTQ